MKTETFTAKTAEEAIRLGLSAWKVDKEEVRIDIIEEASKGFLGFGQKDATVRLTLLFDPVKIVEDFLRRVFEGMGITGRIESEYSEGDLKIKIEEISSEDKGILIGKRGNTLDSIQYLAGLTVNKGKEDYIRVAMNVEDYREKREETLKQLALRMAEKAKKTHRSIKLEPMNPYERRTIHSALQGVAGISTYSEGAEPYRRVVIVHNK